MVLVRLQIQQGKKRLERLRLQTAHLLQLEIFVSSGIGLKGKLQTGETGRRRFRRSPGPTGPTSLQSSDVIHGLKMRK